MAEFFNNHPIKITIATAVIVLMAIVSATYAAGLKDADIENRVGNMEEDFIDYQLKDVPLIINTVERIDKNVQKLIDKK